MSNEGELMLDVSQAHELKMAFRRTRGVDGARWTSERIKKLTEGPTLGLVLDVMNGNARIDTSQILDLDSSQWFPLPRGYLVKENQHQGQFLWDPKRVLLYRSKKQRQKEGCSLADLLQEMTKKSAFNSCLASNLLYRSYLIPEEWKPFSILFFGTIYFQWGNDKEIAVYSIRWNEDHKKWEGDLVNHYERIYKYDRSAILLPEAA